MFQISGSSNHTVLLRPDGTVRAVGCNDDGQCDVWDWFNIVAISAGDSHTVGLRRDGTVLAVGSNFENACQVQSWSQIVAVSAGFDQTVGLCANGTAVTTDTIKPVIPHRFCAVECLAGGIIGLRANGTIFVDAIPKSALHQAANWTNIIDIKSVGYLSIIGLRSDGTVLGIGDHNHKGCDVQSWTGITAISAGDMHTVGLRADGTVVATGANWNGECNVQSWTNVSKVWAGPDFTAAVQHDGTILCTDPRMKQWIIESLS